MGDRSVVTVLQEVGLVGDRQEGEDGPFDSRVVGGASDNVSAEQRPSHRLRDTRLKVDGEWVSS